ncbi:hypothetical protein AAG570_006460 [Ranatra chinensis]|uniref:Uncharacterized protein n=1 Tax=Ranatra chinensis TaxID=642074 RepID=A0ABD0YUQ1_9HEMI
MSVRTNKLRARDDRPRRKRACVLIAVHSRDMSYDLNNPAEDGDYPKSVRTNKFRARDDRPRELHHNQFPHALNKPKLQFLAAPLREDSALGTYIFSSCEASRGGGVSPRMEFPEWKPLGRGDPLKDPTNEYLPPVLDKVRYWLPTTGVTPAAPTHSAPHTDTTEPLSSRMDNYEPLLRYRTSAITPSSGYLGHHHHHLHHHHGHHHHHHHGHHHLHTQADDDEFNSMMMPPPPVMLMPPPMVTGGEWPLEDSGRTGAPTQTPPTSTASWTEKEPATEPPPPQMTTDPLFSHYKQPPEALKGPMYLIIQGHSKVKKYGASKVDPISGISIRHLNQVERKLAR